MINLVFLSNRIKFLRFTKELYSEQQQYDPTLHTVPEDNLTYDGNDIIVKLWCQEEVQKKEAPDKGDS